MVVCYSECLPFIFIQAVLPLSMCLPSRAEMRRGDGGDWWDRRRVLPSHGCMRSCSWLLLGPSSCLVWMASGYISTQPWKLNEAYIMQIRDRERERERGEVWRRVITEQPCVVLLVEATEGDVSIFLCENLALLRERKETFYDYLLKIINYISWYIILMSCLRFLDVTWHRGFISEQTAWKHRSNLEWLCVSSGDCYLTWLGKAASVIFRINYSKCLSDALADLMHVLDRYPA